LSRFHTPTLSRIESALCTYWTDAVLRDEGVLVAFSERAAGTSEAPYASLNLASHVGDDPTRVDENRSRLLAAVGLEPLRARLTMAEQVHGERIGVAGDAAAGAGAFAQHGPAPIAATDGLMCTTRQLPVALCFADCVPVVLVAPGPMVAVVHAGWRGALASLPGRAAERLACEGGTDVADMRAYIGAHIRACHYQVDDKVMSHFVNAFGTFARAESGGLDLDAVVSASLERAGVARCNIARLGICTAEATDRFFSYRAEGGMTGRHAALACIL
jgi:purine-nucleoside/S-methyl-5'-thioadenosine phosphorylase / adenosine deaminase